MLLALPDGGSGPYVAASPRDIEIFVLRELETTDFSGPRWGRQGRPRWLRAVTAGQHYAVYGPLAFLFFETSSADRVVIGGERGGVGWRGSVPLRRAARRAPLRIGEHGFPVTRGVFQRSLTPRVFVA